MMIAWKRTFAVVTFGAALMAAPVMGAVAAETSAAPAAVIVAQADHAPVPTEAAGQGTADAAHAGAPGEAAHGGAAKHETHFPPFDGTTFASQLLWLALTFGLLYYLMSKVTLPRIGRILEERHDRIADDLEEASKHRAESEAAQQAYEKALSEARAKAHSIAADTRDRLSADADANRKALESELTAKLAAAEERIAATKSEALTHVRGIAVDATQSIVSTLIGAAPAASDVEKAVDGALSQHGQA